MSIIKKYVDFFDYITFYNELAFIIAGVKVEKKRVFLLCPSKDSYRSRFLSSAKKILSGYKKDGVINAFLPFSDIKEEKTVAKYLLNLFPELSSIIGDEECGFVVKL